jgi:hypothetical protein
MLMYIITKAIGLYYKLLLIELMVACGTYRKSYIGRAESIKEVLFHLYQSI